MKVHVEILDGTKTHLPFRFQGFWSEGACYLRVQSRKNSLVFLCAQLPNYHGTSVTNAVETIRSTAFDQLEADRLISVNTEISLFERLFEQKEALENKRALEVRRQVMDRSVWIEYYPPGVGLLEEGSYAEVLFSEGGEPSWTHLSKEALSRKYEGLDLSVPLEELPDGIHRSPVFQRP